jgi:hypothetical protein
VIRRRHFAVLVAAGVSTLPATVLAQRLPSLVTPTTTTTTTMAPVIVTPTTTTAPPVIVTPSTTTAAPVIVTATTTTTAPVIVSPTATTAPPVIVTPSTTTGFDDLVQATVAPDGDGSDVPLGAIDTSGAVPEDLDVTAFPGAPEAPTSGADGPTFAAGFSCAYQCIKSGVAYPRGFGALLVIETHVPARLFVSVVDANYDAVDATNSTGMVSDFSWALDHLDPGGTYYAMVAATDEHGDTAYAYGQFITLDERTVEITISSPAVSGGPTNIVDTDVWLKTVDLDFWYVSPPETLVYYSLPRHVDLVLLTFRQWATSQSTFCEGIDPDGNFPAQGDSDEMCGSWNSALLGHVDLDVIPAGESRWTSVTVSTAFNTSSGDSALPDSYGDPRFFHFSAPVTLDVSYS